VSGPVDKATLSTLAVDRLQEARCLIQNQFWSGAYYLGGYSIELALKGCLAKQFRAEQIPDPRFVRPIFTHDLAELLNLAGLSDARRNEAGASAEFDKNWGIVRNWKEDSRYELISEDRARALIDAVGDPKNGVLQWIRRHW
jgi:HEPN domain-containing protein